MENENKILENEIKPKIDPNLKNVYEEEIFDVINQLEEISTTSSNYLSKMSTDFTHINKSFSQEIKDHIINKALKFKDLFNLENKSENKEKINSGNSSNSSKGLILLTKKTIKLIKKIKWKMKIKF